MSDDFSATVYELDIDERAMLIERVYPGKALSGVLADNDDAGYAVVADLFEKVWSTPIPSSGAVSEVDLSDDFIFASTDPTATSLLDPKSLVLARNVYQGLYATPVGRSLLHGDLHHENILSATRRPWLIIDPKGVVGEPAYDLAGFIINPLSRIANQPKLGEFLTERIEGFADRLGMDSNRILEWTYVRAVVAEISHVQDHGATMGVGLTIARALEGYLDPSVAVS